MLSGLKTLYIYRVLFLFLMILSHAKQASNLLFCETYLVFYILNFEKVSERIFFKISLLYLKCFT